MKHAINTSSTRLNYSKATAQITDKKWRRKFVAGWDWSPGTKITHISKTEKKKIKAIQARYPRFSNLRADSQQDQQCLGSNWVIEHYEGHAHDTIKYFDSCRTAALIFWYNTLAGDLGVLAALVPEISVFLAVAAVVAVLDAEIMSYWQNVSSLSSIYIRNHNGWGTVRAQ